MTRLGGTKVGSSAPVRVNVAKVRVPLTTVVIAWLARRAWAGIWFLLRRPVLLLALALLALGWRVTLRHGPAPVGLVLTLATASLALWWRLGRESFTRHVWWRLRGAWRGMTVYRYSWQPAMTTAGLDLTVDGVEHLPRLVSVRTSGCVDLVRVRMLPGQTFADYAAAADRLGSDVRRQGVPGPVGPASTARPGVVVPDRRPPRRRSPALRSRFELRPGSAAGREG